MIDAERHAIHAETEIERLPKRQQSDVAEQKVGAGRKQRPDQNFRNHAHPEGICQRRDQPGHRDQEGRGARCHADFEGAPGHLANPLNRPWGRSSSTALISTSEEIRATVGSATLWIIPSRNASRTAAATVPGKLPSPPMMTAMKQNGNTSMPPRKSTVVIGAATAPPNPAKANPTPKVST